MYWPDQIACQNFYSTPLGLIVKRAIRQHLRQRMPARGVETMLSIGFCQPFIGGLPPIASSFLCMPASLGGVHWPEQPPHRGFVSDEADIPLPDQSIDHILITHVLEHTPHTTALMQECWRLLTPGGSLWVVTPNRNGWWARAEDTPFGYGHPYSNKQLQRLLQAQQFNVKAVEGCLYFLPSQNRWLLKTAPTIENMGKRGFGAFPGLLVCEAEKTRFAVKARPLVSKRPLFYGQRANPVSARTPHG